MKTKFFIPFRVGGRLLLALLITLPCAMAQQSETPPARPPDAAVQSSAAPEPTAPAQSDGRYRIGAGDVLDIRVMGGRFSPELSRDNVNVEQDGTIRIPMIEDDVPAACLTVSELAAKIRGLYKKYKNDPHVDVFVKEYNSQPVAVIGAVGKPGQFQMRRRIRLLELLTLAGGPSAQAGARVQIIRAVGGFSCDDAPATDTDAASAKVAEDIAGTFMFFNLSDTLAGDEQANPYLRPGDVVSLPEADQAYVVGNVLRPTAIPLKESITISRAIAIAGGTMPDTKKDKIRIIRQSPGSTAKTEIFVDLRAIDNRRAEDIALQANDIIDVPTSGGKRLLRSLVGTIVPTVGQLPVQVIR